MTDIQIARINELARKKKAEGLSPSEAEEQRILREDYRAAMRRNLEGQLMGYKYEPAQKSEDRSQNTDDEN
ncbi:MAG: DUF896 domain-containing protein [Ruminococcus sp.]|jgi:uncharacterized protein YnzC (UPF0291/DUF896 family)|nr:DUF896 domain-containing protein [Ruminococcus sp.]